MDTTSAQPPAGSRSLGALVDPEDVAALAAFLLGPHSKSITGQNYVICRGSVAPVQDGGFHLRVILSVPALCRIMGYRPTTK